MKLSRLYLSLSIIIGCSQKPATFDLKGNWTFEDSTGKMVLEFVDDSTVRYFNKSGSQPFEIKREGTYKVANLDKSTKVLTMYFKTESITENLIRPINDTTMQLQIGGIDRPLQWKVTSNNTITFRKTSY
jgi:hypothetical protein